LEYYIQALDYCYQTPEAWSRMPDARAWPLPL